MSYRSNYVTPQFLYLKWTDSWYYNPEKKYSLDYFSYLLYGRGYQPSRKLTMVNLKGLSYNACWSYYHMKTLSLQDPNMSTPSHGKRSTSSATRGWLYRYDDYFELHRSNNPNAAKGLSFPLYGCVILFLFIVPSFELGNVFLDDANHT